MVVVGGEAWGNFKAYWSEWNRFGRNVGVSPEKAGVWSSLEEVMEKEGGARPPKDQPRAEQKQKFLHSKNRKYRTETKEPSQM